MYTSELLFSYIYIYTIQDYSNRIRKPAQLIAMPGSMKKENHILFVHQKNFVTRTEYECDN